MDSLKPLSQLEASRKAVERSSLSSLKPLNELIIELGRLGSVGSQWPQSVLLFKWIADMADRV